MKEQKKEEMKKDEAPKNPNPQPPANGRQRAKGKDVSKDR